MTVEASAWAIDVVVGDPLAKLVLVALSDWAIPGQRCRMRVARLAVRTELEPQQVIDRLLMLHRRGYLTYMRVDKAAVSFEYTLPDSETMQTVRAALAPPQFDLP